MDKTFAIYNFGCKVNQEEGGAIAALFAEQGWQHCDDEPQLIIVNTCTVTAIADKKARNLIRRLRREHANAVLAVCGCYAQRAAEELTALAGIDIIAGVDERRQLPQLVQCHLENQREKIVSVAPIENSHKFQRISETNRQRRARAYLKIEDGCAEFCNYCIIPHVRGPVRSLPLVQAVEQAQSLVADGHKEIVLSGIHIGAYGSDLAQGQTLPALITALLRLPGLERLRLGSIEPQQFSPELTELIANEQRICAHLHIPLQSGCDSTLQAMGRRYTTQFYSGLIAALQSKRPEIAFTTDVIVGFPGETEADFATTAEFIKGIDFAAMHIFPYSKRSGTLAAQMDGQVQQATKAARAAKLNDIAKAKAGAYANRFMGQSLDLLPEEIVQIGGKKYLSGHSNNYLHLLLPWQESQIPHKILMVRPEKVIDEGIVVGTC